MDRSGGRGAWSRGMRLNEPASCSKVKVGVGPSSFAVVCLDILTLSPVTIKLKRKQAEFLWQHNGLRRNGGALSISGNLSGHELFSLTLLPE